MKLIISAIISLLWRHGKMFDEMFNYMVETGIATEREIRLARALKGYNEETLNSVLYYFTGMHYEQLLEEEGE
jgi:hypothetical protein